MFTNVAAEFVFFVAGGRRKDIECVTLIASENRDRVKIRRLSTSVKEMNKAELRGNHLLAAGILEESGRA